MTQTASLELQRVNSSSELFFSLLTSLSQLTHDLHCGRLSRVYVLDACKRILELYNAERLRLLYAALKRAKKSWCTKCRDIYNENDMKPLYIETKVKSKNICLRELHMMCNDCYRIASEGKSGWDHAGVQYKVRYVVEYNESALLLAPFGWKGRNQEHILLSSCVVLELSCEHVTEEIIKTFCLPPTVRVDVDSEQGMSIHIEV